MLDYVCLLFNTLGLDLHNGISAAHSVASREKIFLEHSEITDYNAHVRAGAEGGGVLIQNFSSNS